MRLPQSVRNFWGEEGFPGYLIPVSFGGRVLLDRLLFQIQPLHALMVLRDAFLEELLFEVDVVVLVDDVLELLVEQCTLLVLLVPTYVRPLIAHLIFSPALLTRVEVAPPERPHGRLGQVQIVLIGLRGEVGLDGADGEVLGLLEGRVHVPSRPME